MSDNDSPSNKSAPAPEEDRAALIERQIRDLPQADQIDREDFTNWAQALAGMDDFHPLSWHIRRLRGIGGSEAIAALAQAEIDEGRVPEAAWHTPAGLVQDKLVRRAPLAPEPAMIRGNVIEEIAADRFLEQTGAKRRADLEQRVQDQTVADHPWMVGNPDLIVQMPDGRVALVDIKAPNEPTKDAEPAYVAQLHHYRRIMAEAGVTPDAMMLAKLDYKSFSMITVPVDYDPALEARLLRGGDSLWQHVLEGREPDMSHCEAPTPDWASVEEGRQAEIKAIVKDAEERLVLEKLLAKSIDEDIKGQIQRIRDALSELGPLRGSKADDLGMSLIRFGAGVSIDEAAFTAAMRDAKADEALLASAYKTTANYDSEAMAKRLAELGDDPERFRLSKLDTTKALQAMEQAGIHYERALGSIVSEKPTLTVAKPKKGEFAEVFEAMEFWVEQTMPNVRSALFSALEDEPTPAPADEARGSLFTEMSESGGAIFSQTFSAGDESPAALVNEPEAKAEAAPERPDPVGKPSATENPAPDKRTDPLDSLFSG